MKGSDVDRVELVNPLPCFVCGRELESSLPNAENQPYGGTEFRTYGHYGSTFWDSFHGEQLVLNVCDDCLRSRTQHLAQQKRYQEIRCGGLSGFGRKWVDEPLKPYTGLEDEATLSVKPSELGSDLPDVQWAKDILEMRDDIVARLPEELR